MINSDGHQIKKIQVMKLHDGRKAEIFFNQDLEEYLVEFFAPGGKHLKGADYFAEDLDDARGTARIQLDSLKF